ncbi:GNAT family N-acetyltransferase [Pontivivens ytuae]|uniref:GNAT family N-acetyltransferase n=1 Tax=Pontivivens ytuae TaxID=2789856 RepID=A0A7S9QE25_9RHOB|nr:GNAT family N-acetyltransferase [Pontivivens ytuae]QPH55505.1 GNAT family N-acetyltransferase [Pontivivens ytuae]
MTTPPDAAGGGPTQREEGPAGPDDGRAHPWAETERLILRQWRDADRAPFAALNADPEVMRYFPSPLDRAGSDAFIDTLRGKWERDGFSFAAVERKADGAFIGMVGLNRPAIALPCGPCVEVGWRIARPYWRQGYASEAARVALSRGFAMGLKEIVAFTPTQNLPSQAVMRAIGMRPDPARDFDHPSVPEGHPLRRLVLYSMTAEEAA